MDKQKKGRPLLTAMMTIIGFALQPSPIISYPHEIGHWLVAHLMGGEAEILTAKRTMVWLDGPGWVLTAAAGYTTEVLVWGILLMLFVKKRQPMVAMAIGGMIATVTMAFPSYDFQKEPAAIPLFVINTIIIMYFVRRVYKRRLAEEKAAEARIKAEIAARKERKRKMANLIAAERKVAQLAAEKKRTYTENTELYGLSSYRRP